MDKIIQFPQNQSEVNEFDSPIMWVERELFSKLIDVTRQHKKENAAIKRQNRILKSIIFGFLIYYYVITI